MADRTVTFTLGTAVDPQAKREAAEMAALLNSVKNAAEGATKAVRDTMSASSRGRGGGGGGGRPPSGTGGGTSRTGSGGFERGYDRAASRSDERREREGILADRRREAQAERKILEDRVRANIEAGRRIREAARETKAGHYTARQRDAESRQQEERDQRSRMQAETAARVRESIEASRAAREAARETKAGNYRARAAGTYGAGYGRGGGGGTPDDGFDASAHVESLGRTRGQEERRAASDRMKAYKEVRGAATAAADATMLYARSIVLLVAADSESAQRAMQLIARYQAMTDVLFGTAKAFEAAAKARKALEAVGGARGLLTMGGGMAAGGGGLLAAGVLGGSALFGGTLGLMGGIKGMMEGKGFKEGAKEAYSMFTEGFTELTGITDKAKESADKWKERWKEVAAKLDLKKEDLAVRTEGRSEMRNAQLSITENDAGVGLSGNNRSLAEARARVQRSANYMREDTAAARRARDNTQVGGLQERMSAETNLKGSRDQYISDTREVLRLETEITREKIGGEKAALSTLQQRRSEARSMLKEAEDAKKSALERFGGLTPSERSRVLSIAKKDQAGEKIPQSEEDFIAPFAKERVTKLRIDRAKAEGADKVLDPYFRAPIGKAQAMINNLDAKIEAKSEIIVKYEADIVKQADATAKALKPLLEANYRAAVAMMDMKIRELVEKETLTQSTSGK